MCKIRGTDFKWPVIDATSRGLYKVNGHDKGLIKVGGQNRLERLEDQKNPKIYQKIEKSATAELNRLKVK